MFTKQKLVLYTTTVFSILLAVLLISPAPPALAEEYEISGSWTATNITGNGSFSFTTGKATSGTINILVDVTGDITGTFNYVANFIPDSGSWQGTSAEINGTVTIDGVNHPATLWLKGDITNFLFDSLPPTSWSCNAGCPVGTTHGWTTDGSKIVADFGWSGACSGNVIVDFDNGTWKTTGSGSGTWNGIASECIAGKTEYVGAGSGVVELAASPVVATLSYEVGEDGTIILARYENNPGGTTPQKNLGKYIQVDSSLVKNNISWPVELRIYYYDDELAASGIDEQNLRMYRWNDNSWDIVSDSGVNKTDNYVWAQLYSFSIYTIQEYVAPPPTTPPPAPVTPQVSPASFILDNLSIEPENVEIAEDVMVSFKAENSGGSTGDYNAVLKINGVNEAEKSINLDAGSSQIVSFTVSKEDVGNYLVEIGELNGSFTVSAPAPVFSISALTITPAEAQTGETVTIDMTVSNTGGSTGDYNAVIKINNVNEAEKTITLDAGSSQIVSFTVAKEDAGSYLVETGELSGSFTVTAPSSTNWLVFAGIALGVVAIVMVSFFLLKRRSS